MKNKWKIGFWICLFLLVFIGTFAIYSIVDQAYTITYMRDGYSGTESDLEELSELLEITGISKEMVEGKLKDHPYYEFMNFNSDTISMERTELIFKNGILVKIRPNR